MKIIGKHKSRKLIDKDSRWHFETFNWPARNGRVEVLYLELGRYISMTSFAINKLIGTVVDPKG